jgi:selenocysteine lyase/cysteine desulfurase
MTSKSRRSHGDARPVYDWRGEPSLRISFQGYNDESDLAALLEALPRVLR